MAKGFEIKGLKKLIGKVDRLPEEIATEVDAVLEAGAKDIVAEAKARAPVDLAFLKNGIGFHQAAPLSYKVTSNMEYSPFVEFGTGGFVQVPAGLESYAQQFRGKGIKEVNIMPQPFLFPAVEKLRPVIIADVKEALKNLK